MIIETRSEEVLIKTINKSDMLSNVFERASSLELDNYYIGAGCIVQTIWNELTNRPLNYGIEDIDIVYFNEKDLSIEDEDKIINKGKEIFCDIPFKVDIKNQARVHLWYGERFGFEIKPYQSVEEAISTWPTTATALGLKREYNNWKVYAPYGLYDLFNLIIRANKRLITEEIYISKANKWKSKWPELQVISWNET